MIKKDLIPFILANGYYKNIRTINQYFKDIYLGHIPSKKLHDNYFKIVDDFGSDYIDTCISIYKSYRGRLSRIRSRIESYLKSGKCIFATLTFEDSVLDSTSEETRRKYVQRFLSSVSDCYVANIDYGVDDKYTHREHYHAVIKVDWISDKWPYGYTWFELVRQTSDDQALSKYISKLVNHSLKESTKRCCYIYSRC